MGLNKRLCPEILRIYKPHNIKHEQKIILRTKNKKIPIISSIKKKLSGLHFI